jgi:hypothetical protein
VRHIVLAIFGIATGDEMTQTMKAAVAREFGKPLTIEEVPMPSHCCRCSIRCDHSSAFNEPPDAQPRFRW